MDLTQLANLGEFIGGVAVLVTLVYLALQVRSSAQEQRAASMRESTREVASVMRDIINTQETSEIWLKGFNNFRELDATERLRFSGLIGHAFRLFEQLFYQSRHGTVEQDVWEGFERQLRDYVAYPGFGDWWPTRAHWYGHRFRAFVESHMRADNRPGLGYGENNPAASRS